MSPLRITVLADNTVTGRQVRGEHGLCFYLEVENRRLLFDTGQGLVLGDNARALDLDLSTIDTVVLSHGHYDHTGGLSTLIQAAQRPITIHAHPDTLDAKYHCTPAGSRSIGLPMASREALGHPLVRLALSDKPEELAAGLWRTGEIPRPYPEETQTEVFHLDPDGLTQDALLDDQSLFIDTPEGTVVLLGCAHAGVIHILDYIQQLTDGRPIRAVLGGMHLGSATPERLDWVLAQLDRIAPQQLMPMHCTGIRAMATLWNRFPQACRPCGAGSVFDFSTAKESP
jgi:7,8-dihydropterin-6-yl-methyl-4-(beta-D-ribofuranosyl)aminobenzene 5'-phosphate synthase